MSRAVLVVELYRLGKDYFFFTKAKLGVETEEAVSVKADSGLLWIFHFKQM